MIIIVTRPERALLIDEAGCEMRRIADIEQFIAIAAAHGNPPIYIDVHNLWARGLVDRLNRLGESKVFWIPE